MARKHGNDRPIRSASRDLAGLGMIKRRRSSWPGSTGTTAQLGGQDKSREVRPGRMAGEWRNISALE
jgi:hypothetical protein